MPSFKSISTASISVLAGWEVWNGSAWVAASNIPTVGDTVYANGFIKVINQNWTVSQIRNTVFQGTTGSGRFEILASAITFNGDRYSNGANILYASFGGGTSTILGQGYVIVGGLTNANAGLQIVGQSGGILNLENSGNGTVTGSIGTMTSGNGNGFEVVCVTAAGNSSGPRCYGFVIEGSNYTCKFTGTQIAGEESGCRAVMIMGNDNTYINQGYATGAITTIDSRVHPAVQNTSELNTIINEGIMEGGATNPALWSFTSSITLNQVLSNTSVNRYVNSNAIINKGVLIEGIWPSIYAPTTQISNLTDSERRYKTDVIAVNKTMYTAGLLTGYPLESKVEDGTIYGPSSEFTGTMLPWDTAFAQALATAQSNLQLPAILGAITS